jgi:hypothetical protein
VLELPKSIYLTSEQIDARIRERKAQLALLAPGQTRLELRREIARLHVYGDMKRLLVMN